MCTTEPEAAALQFGYNCDYIEFAAQPHAGLLVVNHDAATRTVFPAGEYDADTIRRIAMASHGMSVVEIKRDTRTSGAWRQVTVSRTRYNRRVTMSTPCGHRCRGHLRTSADHPDARFWAPSTAVPAASPWGTVLTGEENFDQYFEASGLARSHADSYAHMRRPDRSWNDRPSLRPVEGAPPFRFGWVVELDPFRPAPGPGPNMLGRFKHDREHRCGPHRARCRSHGRRRAR